MPPEQKPCADSRRSLFTFQVLKERSPNGKLVCEGYLTDWTEPDREGDIIDPAFAEKGTANFQQNPVYFFHHPKKGDIIAARGTMTIADKKGIKVRFEPLNDTEERAFVYNEIEQGNLRCLSGGYSPYQGQGYNAETITREDGTTYQLLKTWDLEHAALTYRPVNPKATFDIISKEIKGEISMSEETPATPAPTPEEEKKEEKKEEAPATDPNIARFLALEERIARLEGIQAKELKELQDKTAILQKELKEASDKTAAINKAFEEAKKPVLKSEVPPPDGVPAPVEPEPKYDHRISALQNTENYRAWQRRTGK